MFTAGVRHTLRALRHRNFRLFFFGQAVSLLGTWMQNLAQSWLVWRLSESEWLLGLVGFAQLAPVLCLGLVGGAAADRFNRHRLIIATQAAALVQASLLAILTLSGLVQIWHVIALAAMLGTINAFDMPGRQSFLVQLVAREDLGNAIALNSSLFNGARVVGPALAGFVVGAWGEGVCFALNAVTYLAVLGALLMMKVAPAAPSHAAHAIKRIAEGLSYAWSTAHVRALLALLMVTSLGAVPYTVLLAAVVGEVLHGGATELGTLMGFQGIGALAGALTMARRSGIFGLGRLAGTSAMGFGAGLLAFSLSQSLATGSACVALVGFCMITQTASTNTLLQSLVPEALRGRLMSLYVIMFMGMAPIGSLVQGRLAQDYGVQAVLAGGALLTIAAGLVFRLSVPRLRKSVRKLIEEQQGAMPPSASTRQM